MILYTTAYAVRQSSKGWSDIVYVAETRKLAEYLCKTLYEAQAKDNEEREARGSLLYKANYRVEDITYWSGSLE